MIWLCAIWNMFKSILPKKPTINIHLDDIKMFGIMMGVVLCGFFVPYTFSVFSWYIKDVNDKTDVKLVACWAIVETISVFGFVYMLMHHTHLEAFQYEFVRGMITFVTGIIIIGMFDAVKTLNYYYKKHYNLCKEKMNND